jgi:hypothetical protein
MAGNAELLQARHAVDVLSITLGAGAGGFGKAYPKVKELWLQFKALVRSEWIQYDTKKYKSFIFTLKVVKVPQNTGLSEGKGRECHRECRN